MNFGKIYSSQFIHIGINIPQEINFLKCRAQTFGIGHQFGKQILIFFTKNLKTHQPHYLGRTVNILLQFVLCLIICFVQIILHTPYKSIYELFFYPILFYGIHESKNNRIGAYSVQ
jgi:hypothetical protein